MASAVVTAVLANTMGVAGQVAMVTVTMATLDTVLYTLGGVE